MHYVDYITGRVDVAGGVWGMCMSICNFHQLWQSVIQSSQFSWSNMLARPKFRHTTNAQTGRVNPRSPGSERERVVGGRRSADS